MIQTLLLLLLVSEGVNVPDRTERIGPGVESEAFVSGLLAADGKPPSISTFQLFSDLVEKGGWGHLETERAAFITVDERGTVRCRLWPRSGNRRTQTYRGRMPSGTVAIVHTHPTDAPHPSPRDQSEAARLGVPIVVLTPRNVLVATSDGKIERIVERRFWPEKTVEGNPQCEEMELS